MKIFNDSNADCKQGTTAVFLQDVEIDEDIMINSSCVFLGDLVTKGSVHAHYNLTVYGHLEAEKEIVVGESLNCYKKVKANTISVQGRFYAAGAVSCKDLSVGRDFICDTVFCQNADIGDSLISDGPIDIQNDIKSAGSIISNEYISVGGNATCKSVIAESLDASNSADTLFIHIETGATEGSPSDQPDGSQQSLNLLEVVDAPLTDIYDSGSDLAVVMEALASIIEHLNEKVENQVGPDEMKLLKGFGSFLPEYERLGYVFQDSLIALHNQELSTAKWFPDFNACAKAYLAFPKWARQSQTAVMLREKIEKLINLYLSRNIVTTSKTEWIRAIGHLQRLMDSGDTIITEHKKALRDKMFENLGLKPFGIMVKLPKE